MTLSQPVAATPADHILVPSRPRHVWMVAAEGKARAQLGDVFCCASVHFVRFFRGEAHELIRLFEHSGRPLIVAELDREMALRELTAYITHDPRGFADNPTALYMLSSQSPWLSTDICQAAGILIADLRFLFNTQPNPSRDGTSYPGAPRVPFGMDQAASERTGEAR